MRAPPPNRLHWVQVRDAVERPGAWRRGRALGLEDELLTVVALDPGARDAAGAVHHLRCPTAEAVEAALTQGIAHPDGGWWVLWTALGRVLAVPVGADCEGDPAAIVVTPSAVIEEHRHRIHLVAGDATWRARLFTVIDTEEALVARARAAARADRSTLFSKVRTRLLEDQTYLALLVRDGKRPPTNGRRPTTTGRRPPTNGARPSPTGARRRRSN